MEAKLKLISGGTRSFLWLKGTVCGCAWYFLPANAFLAVALLMYFFPVFDPFRLTLPGVIFLMLALSLPKSLPSALLVGIIFFLLLGIKDLILVRRLEAYELAVFLLLFGGSFLFFMRAATPQTAFLAPLAGLCAAFYFLARRMSEYDEFFVSREIESRWLRLGFGLSALALFELGVVLVFLPINFFYQTAIFFLSLALLTDLCLEYAKGRLDRVRILRRFSWFLAFLVVVLTLNRWEL